MTLPPPDPDGTSSGSSTSTNLQYLVVARVVRPHGVRGDLRVQALTAFPERMNRLEQIFLSRDPDDPARFVSHTVQRIRPDKGDMWLLHLEGVEDRDLADEWRDHYVLVSLADAVPLEADEVYLFQVMGLSVQTRDGRVLGRVTDIIETGANDVFVVRGELYGEVLIPHIDSVVRQIDVEAGIVWIDPLPGLLPE